MALNQATLEKIASLSKYSDRQLDRLRQTLDETAMKASFDVDIRGAALKASPQIISDAKVSTANARVEFALAIDQCKLKRKHSHTRESNEKLSKEEKASKACRFYFESDFGCKLGDKCEFSHDEKVYRAQKQAQTDRQLAVDRAKRAKRSIDLDIFAETARKHGVPELLLKPILEGRMQPPKLEELIYTAQCGAAIKAASASNATTSSSSSSASSSTSASH